MQPSRLAGAGAGYDGYFRPNQPAELLCPTSATSRPARSRRASSCSRRRGSPRRSASTGSGSAIPSTHAPRRRSQSARLVDDRGDLAGERPTRVEGGDLPTIRVHPAVIAQAARTNAVLLGVGASPWASAPGRRSTSTSTAIRGRRCRSGSRCSRRPWRSSARCGPGRTSAARGSTSRSRTRASGRVRRPRPTSSSRASDRNRSTRGADRRWLRHHVVRPRAVRRLPVEGAAGAQTHAGFKVARAPTTGGRRRRAPDLAQRRAARRALPGAADGGALRAGLDPRHPRRNRGRPRRGSDAADHLEVFAPFNEAGFDEVYVATIGPHDADMIRAHGSEVLPQLRPRRRSPRFVPGPPGTGYVRPNPGRADRKGPSHVTQRAVDAHH